MSSSSDDVRILLVPASGVAALQRLAVGVLRAHGHDDVFPDLPDELLERLPVFTLQRPASAFFADATAWAGDARDAFAGGTPHAGLVITAQRQQAGVLMLASPRASCSRFPWHPGCERIAARCCSLGRAQLLEASARGKQSLQQATAGLTFPQQLVPVAVHNEPAFLQDLAAAVMQHNAHALQQQQQQQQQPAPIPLLLETVQEAAAAVAIQAAWRAHSSRLRHQIAERALAGRAARAIQAAWRTFVLCRRLAMLSAAASAHRHAQAQLRFSNIMCLDVGSCRLVQAAAEAAQRGAALFPEHRLWFVLEPELGDLFLVESSSSNGDGDSSSSDSVRSGLPAWLGADIPVIPAACFAAEAALGRAHTRTLLEANCLVKDLLDPDAVAAGACRLSDVAQLVTFSSRQQAAQRAALLAAFTFDVRSRQHARLLTVQESPLGAAYRSLTGFNSTATKAASAATAAVCSGGSSAAVPASQCHHHAMAEAAAAAAAPCDAAAALAPPALTGQPPAAARSSPRDCMFRRPLQPICPTDTLLAATTAAAASSSSSSSGGDAGVQGAASAGVQFHVSVLSRFPHLLRVLAAADAAHAAVGEQRPGVQQQQQSGVVLDTGAAELMVQPPAAVACQPGIISEGAYALLTKLAEVRGGWFQGSAGRHRVTAGAAVKAAAAEHLLRQQAVAAAKAAAEAGGKECALLSTSNCASPTYWPDTPTEAAAAAHAARQQTAATAARRVMQLREQQLREQHEAQQQQEQRQARSKAAGQLERQVAQHKLQVQQQQQQVAATTQASALKQLREAAPAARLEQQQGVAAFATTCNQLSKRMRACIVAAARQADGQAKAAAAQQQRQQDAQAAVALRCRQQEAHGAAKASAGLQASAAQADLAAVRAIQELEAAAKRAAAAARRLPEQACEGRGRGNG